MYNKFYYIDNEKDSINFAIKSAYCFLRIETEWQENNLFMHDTCFCYINKHKIWLNGLNSLILLTCTQMISFIIIIIYIYCVVDRSKAV